MDGVVHKGTSEEVMCNRDLEEERGHVYKYTAKSVPGRVSDMYLSSLPPTHNHFPNTMHCFSLIIIITSFFSNLSIKMCVDKM